MSRSHIKMDYGEYDDFSGEDFTRDEILGVRFIGTRLREAQFNGGRKYRDVRFHSCDMTGANLAYAEFSGTLSFSGSNLTHAILQGAKLKGKLIPNAILEEASSLSGAILPDGTRHW